MANEVEPPQTTSTPEEAIQQAETQISNNLKSLILERISELSPTFFERLVVDLIVAMAMVARVIVSRSGLEKAAIKESTAS